MKFDKGIVEFQLRSTIIHKWSSHLFVISFDTFVMVAQDSEIFCSMNNLIKLVATIEVDGSHKLPSLAIKQYLLLFSP
jgi:hypothetical protein